MRLNYDPTIGYFLLTHHLIQVDIFIWRHSPPSRSSRLPTLTQLRDRLHVPNASLNPSLFVHPARSSMRRSLIIIKAAWVRSALCPYLRLLQYGSWIGFNCGWSRWFWERGWIHIWGSVQRHRPTRIVKVGLVGRLSNQELELDVSKSQPLCHPLVHPVRVSSIPSIQSSPVLPSHSPNQHPCCQAWFLFGVKFNPRRRTTL